LGSGLMTNFLSWLLISTVNLSLTFPKTITNITQTQVGQLLCVGHVFPIASMTQRERERERDVQRILNPLHIVATAKLDDDLSYFFSNIWHKGCIFLSMIASFATSQS